MRAARSMPPRKPQGVQQQTPPTSACSSSSGGSSSGASPAHTWRPKDFAKKSCTSSDTTGAPPTQDMSASGANTMPSAPVSTGGGDSVRGKQGEG